MATPRAASCPSDVGSGLERRRVLQSRVPENVLGKVRAGDRLHVRFEMHVAGQRRSLEAHRGRKRQRAPLTDLEEGGVAGRRGAVDVESEPARGVQVERIGRLRLIEEVRVGRILVPAAPRPDGAQRIGVLVVGPPRGHGRIGVVREARGLEKHEEVPGLGASRRQGEPGELVPVEVHRVAAGLDEPLGDVRRLGVAVRRRPLLIEDVEEVGSRSGGVDLRQQKIVGTRIGRGNDPIRLAEAAPVAERSRGGTMDVPFAVFALLGHGGGRDPVPAEGRSAGGIDAVVADSFDPGENRGSGTVERLLAELHPR